MKLIICKQCDDIVRLIHTNWRKCECGKSGGQYNEDLQSATVGGNCEVIGIKNDWVAAGKQKRREAGLNHIIQGEYLGDVQIHRIISPEGPRLNIEINEVDKDFNELTFKDRRNYTINVKGANKSPKTVKVPKNKKGPSFKTNEDLKEFYIMKDTIKKMLRESSYEGKMPSKYRNNTGIDFVKTKETSSGSKYEPKKELPKGIDEVSIKEDREKTQTYMFWQNLKTMHHAISELLEMGKDKIDTLLEEHAWAIDHIATSADDVEEVYHFIESSVEDHEEWEKPMELDDSVNMDEISEGLKYHLNKKLPIGDSAFRYGSKRFFDLLKEVQKLEDKGLIKLNKNDKSILEDHNNQYVDINGDLFKLNFIMEDLDSEETINEAEYKGKEVKLNKPKRGGSKKFYVYVKNPKTGKVKKVSFGAKSGGGKLAVKLKDPKARKAFDKRHGCSAGRHNDKTKPGYWSCRLPSYAKLLGLSSTSARWW